MITAQNIAIAAVVGVGGTVILDAWAVFLARSFGIAGVSWPMVGRWIGNMPRGVFVHNAISTAPPVRDEAVIGWTAHYLIGIGYGLVVLALFGPGWFEQPTILPPLLVSWSLLAAPYFIMMPGMGSGIAGSNTPQPNMARLKSFGGHSIFGVGMFVTASAIASFMS